MIKKIVSIFLIFAMILPLGLTNIYADETEEQKIRIYSSSDASRHDMNVIIENNKVFIDVTQLIKLYNGEILLGINNNPGYQIISNFDEIYNQYTDKNASDFILTNGFVDLKLVYSIKKDSWYLFDTSIPGKTDKMDMYMIDAPIFKDGKIYVDLLYTARFLGGIVNITNDKDGIIIHVPKISSGTVIRDALFFVNGDHGMTVQLDDNLYNDSLIFVDVFLDCVGGELGTWITGEYDIEKFKDIIFSFASKEEKVNYIKEIWEGYDYTVDFLDTDIGMDFVDIATDGYSDYVDYLKSNPEIKELLDKNNASSSEALNVVNATWASVIDLYSYNQRILQLATDKVNLLNNIYVTNKKYMYDEAVSVWGESIEDITEDIVNDYYNGVSGNDVLNSLVKNTGDIAISTLLEGDGLSKLLGVNTEQVAALESITPSSTLTYCKIMLNAFEKHFGYEYGSLKEVNTIKEMQIHLREALTKALKNEVIDKETLKFINNCAIMYCELYHVYRGSFDNVNETYLEVYNRIKNTNIADAVMNTYSNREWLSKAKSEELLNLVFTDESVKVDFVKLKEILGYPSATGVTYGSMNAVADFDNDGYKEIFLSIPDDRYHSNYIWVVIDLNDGVLSSMDWYAHTGPERMDWRQMDQVFYYDTTGQNYAFRVQYNHGYDSNQSVEYFKWTNNGFEKYFIIEDSNTLEKSYVLKYEGMSEYEGKKYAEGIIHAYNTEYDISNSFTIEDGNDIINYYNDFIKDIEDAVKAINKDLGVDEGRFYPGDESKKYVRYGSFIYNKDRSLFSISSTNDCPQHLFENAPQIWDYMVPTYYFDTESREIFYKQYPPEFMDDTYMNWEIEHGFEY